MSEYKPSPAAHALGGSPSVILQILTLIGLWLIVFAAAAIGASLTSSSLGAWYESLAKPTWNPPNWVFGPVWSALYIAMGVAAWLVWRRSGWYGGRWALASFILQLALNVGWSGVFFGLRSPGLALIEIVALWLAVAVTAILFYRHDRIAGLLLAPYLAWCTFAGALNLAIWRLNS